MTEEEIERTLLPSEKAKKQEETEKAAAEYKNLEASMLREDFTLTFQTEHGQRVLAWIQARCGHNLPPLAADKDGNYDTEKTLHNAMELSFYLAIRKYIPRDVLYGVEFGLVKPSGHIDLEDFKKRITSKDQSKTKGTTS